MVENFIQKKAGLFHHARGVRGQKLGDAPRVKTVRARVFKKDAHNFSYKKIFCVRVPVDESEICIRIGTVNFAVLGVKITST